MIKNERQFRITKAQADKFRRAIAAADAGETPTDDNGRRLKALELAGMRSQLETLDQELKTYENLQRARGKRSLAEPLEHLGVVLVQARIARGWTQVDLGERIGVKMQQIQRYEATFYEKASLERIREVCQALGLAGHVSARLIELPDPAELVEILHKGRARAAAAKK